MKVWIHMKKLGESEWGSEFREFARIPAMGEYIALNDSSPWYEVKLVVHAPFEGSNCDAEIYAIGVDHNKVKRQASGM